MIDYEKFIFHDGYHDLMIRRPDNGDYIAFDEHGLIFIYTKKDYDPILTKLNATHTPEADLIYNYDHWHYRSATGRQDLQSLITALSLTR